MEWRREEKEQLKEKPETIFTFLKPINTMLWTNKPCWEKAVGGRSCSPGLLSFLCITTLSHHCYEHSQQCVWPNFKRVAMCCLIGVKYVLSQFMTFRVDRSSLPFSLSRCLPVSLSVCEFLCCALVCVFVAVCERVWQQCAYVWVCACVCARACQQCVCARALACTRDTTDSL